MGKVVSPPLQHCYDADPVTFTAIREEGVWSPSGDTKRKLPFVKFSPSDGAGSGPKIVLQESFLLVEEEEAELYVNSMNATVWLLGINQSGFDRDTLPQQASLTEALVEEVCGPVDCIITWCVPAEVAMRVAESRPDLIRTVIGVSSPLNLKGTWPPEMVEMMLHAMLADFVGTMKSGLGNHCHSGFIESPQFHALFDRLKEEGAHKLDGWLEDCREAQSQGGSLLEKSGMHFATFITPWSHWDRIQQPVLVIAGTDDAHFLAGMELLTSTVPNAEIEYVQGVSHIPQIEAPQKYRDAVLGFLRRHCTPATNGEKLPVHHSKGSKDSTASRLTAASTAGILSVQDFESLVFDDDGEMPIPPENDEPAQPRCGDSNVCKPGCWDTGAAGRPPAKLPEGWVAL